MTIPAGSLTGQITLIGKSNGIYGPDLPVSVGIASAINATPGGGSVLATITEEIPNPSPLSRRRPAPSRRRAVPATFAVTLNETSLLDTSLTFTYGGTAKLGTDYNVSGNNYTPATQTLVIPAGNTTGFITVSGLNNQTFGPDLTAIVTLTSAVNAAIQGLPTSTATITEGNPGPTVTLGLTGSPIAELGGVPGLVTASIPARYTSPVVIHLTFTGSAVLGVNYTASGTDFNPADDTLTIPAGATSSTVALAPLDDHLYGPNLTVTVAIQSLAPGIAPGGPVTATITNGDPPPSVALNTSTGSVSEAGGQATITATLSAPSGFNTVVPLTFAGNAVYGTNYTILGQNYNPNTHSLTINAGQTSASILMIGQSNGQYGPNLTALGGVGASTGRRPLQVRR